MASSDEHIRGRLSPDTEPEPEPDLEPPPLELRPPSSGAAEEPELNPDPLPPPARPARPTAAAAAAATYDPRLYQNLHPDDRDGGVPTKHTKTKSKSKTGGGGGGGGYGGGGGGGGGGDGGGGGGGSLIGIAGAQGALNAFDFLPTPADVLSAATACRRWRELARADSVWRARFEREGLVDKARAFEVALPAVSDGGAAGGGGGGGSSSRSSSAAAEQEDELIGVGLAFYVQVFALKVMGGAQVLRTAQGASTVSISPPLASDATARRAGVQDEGYRGL